MKNVIVFALGASRYAVELRWVREVFSLGHVTPVPHAPDVFAGVVNYRGAIMTLLDLEALLGRRPAGAPIRRAHAGESAILLSVEDWSAALRVSSVAEVSTLRPPPGGAADQLIDSTGQSVPLIDPPSLFARASQASQAAAAALRRTLA